MFVPCNNQPFGNKYHTIRCELFKVIYHIESIEGKDQPWGMGWKEFDEKENMAGLMVLCQSTYG